MPRRGDRRGTRKGATLAAAVGLVVMIGAGIGLVAIGPEPLVPVPGLTVRLDLLASRDLEVNGDLPAGGASDNKPLVSDQTWTRTGGESCYPISSTDASCFAASEVPYTVDATGTGWVVEPDATNRILYSALAGGIDCTNWTCRGTGDATPGEVAPDGSATASLVVAGTAVNDVYQLSSGYTATATLHPRIWIKCSSGEIRLVNATLGTAGGQWGIDCATVSAGAWTLVNGVVSGVVEHNAWVSSGGGSAGLQIVTVSGTVTASIWAPTLTEETGTGLAVIPTGASAVSTGDPVWAIANGGTYWRSGDTVTQTISEISGTCFVADATTITLTGAAGSECAGIWYGLEISK